MSGLSLLRDYGDSEEENVSSEGQEGSCDDLIVLKR